jgi:tetraacyldisaccharide 4'-kinase
LARDLDLVLLDASEPFGFEYVLPRGTLREPIAGLRRAQAIALSRADMIDQPQREAIRRRALAICPHAAWCEVEHRPARLIDSAGTCYPLADATEKPVAAFCGIGNPAGFRHTLASLDCDVAAWREFPDHHGYSRDDVTQLAEWTRQAGVATVLCTRKDLVKLRTTRLGDAALRAVDITLQFLCGQEALDTLLAPLADQAKRAEVDLLDAEA